MMRACQKLGTTVVQLLPLLVLTMTVLPAGYSQDRKRVEVDVEEVTRSKESARSRNQMSRAAFSRIEVEDKLRQGIDRTIKFYKEQASRMSKGATARVDILERILQLNLEQASYVRSAEERAYDKKWAEWD